MDLSKFNISEGSHSDKQDGTCIMEAVSVITGEDFGDHPICVAVPITELAIELNDNARSTRSRNKYLRPLIPCLIGTAKLRPVRFKRYDCTLKKMVPFEIPEQVASHNRKVQSFINNHWRKTFNEEFSSFPDDSWDSVTGSHSKKYLRYWIQGVNILREAALYAKELLGPTHDVPQCCSPEFLELLKSKQPVVKSELLKV